MGYEYYKPDGLNYLIFKRGTNYYCMDGATGLTKHMGTDAGTAIQYALNNGGKILIKGGTYPIAASLELYDNTELLGEGRSTILQHAAALGNNYLLINEDTAGGNQDIIIRDLSIDGNDAAHATLSEGIHLNNVDNSILANLWIYDIGQGGIIFYDSCYYASIKNCFISNCGHHSIGLQRRSKYLTVDSILSQTCGTNAAHLSIAHDTGGVGVSHCSISKFYAIDTASGRYGIYFDNCDKIAVSDSYFYNTNYWNCYIADAQNILLENCLFDTTTAASTMNIYCHADSEKITISNCHCKTPNAGAQVCIEADGEDITIIGCVLEDAERPVGLVAGSERVNILDNTFYDINNSLTLRGTNTRIIGNTWSTMKGTPAYLVYYASETGQVVSNNCMNVSVTTAKINTPSSLAECLGNIGFITRNEGAATGRTDGSTITHGLNVTPTWAICTPSVAGEMVSVTALGASTFTIAIKTHAGAAGTNQTIYWRAGI